MQEDALKNEGCEKIYRDTVSGVKSVRPGLDSLVEQLRDGDTLVVYKLDRLARSLKHLIQLIEYLTKKGVGLKSLNDPIDTTTAQGRLITSIVGVMAEFERELTVERTKAGLNAARARGRKGGRRPGLSKVAEDKAIVVAAHYQEGNKKVDEIAKDAEISKTTLYKYLRHRGIEVKK